MPIAIKKLKINGNDVEAIRWCAKNCYQFHQFVGVKHSCGTVNSLPACGFNRPSFVLDDGEEIKNKEWLVKRSDGTFVVCKRNPQLVAFSQLLKSSFLCKRESSTTH